MGKRRTRNSDECPGRDWWLMLNIAKFTLYLRDPAPAPTCPLLDHPSLRAHHSSLERSGFFQPGLQWHLPSHEAQASVCQPSASRLKSLWASAGRTAPSPRLVWPADLLSTWRDKIFSSFFFNLLIFLPMLSFKIANTSEARGWGVGGGVGALALPSQAGRWPLGEEQRCWAGGFPEE